MSNDKAAATYHPDQDGQIKVLRAQGLSDEQIQDWLDHNSIQPEQATKKKS